MTRDDLLPAVRQLYAAIERFDAAAAARLGVDRTALRAINTMEAGRVSPGQLGVALGLSSGAVTALLDRLEAAGHVTRSQSADDRRRRDAHLTPQAYAAADGVYSGLGAAIEAAVSTWDEAAVVSLVRGLAAIGAAFDRAAAPPE